MKIAINGCGVAGPTLAWWLRKAGHEPVLFEQAPSLRTGGYLIDFWGYGFDVAEKMQLMPALRERGYIMQQLLSYNAAGKQTSRVDGEVFVKLTKGRYLSIERSALAAVIYAACDGIETRFGTSVTGLQEDAGGVDVTLNTGSTERFDLLIGADGLHSAVRALAFGPEAEFMRPTGLNVAAFVLDGYPQRDELSYVTYSEPLRQVNRISLRDDRTLFLCIFTDATISAFPHGEAEQKACLRQALSGMQWEVPQILARLDAVPDIYFDPVAQVHMDSWHKGRVALTGDAAACASLLAGEGTALAMLEAYVLAGKLAAADGDHASAFAAYHAALAPMLRKKQAAALRFSSFFAPPNRFRVWLRDQLINISGKPMLARYLLGPMLLDNRPLSDF